MKKDIFLPDPALLALFEKTKARLMMKASLNLRMSVRQISPMVIGLIRPVVIIPVSVLSGLNPEQVEAIFVHELAHIRRYDHVMMILQAITSQILFFHPVAWFLSTEINRERENCCDDLVIRTFPNPINYIKALTMIQQMNGDGQVPANALLGRSKRLLGRVKRLLKTEKRHAPVFRMAVIFLLFITLGIAAITIASAGNTSARKSLEKFFTPKPEKMQFVADTIKTRKHEKTAVNKEPAHAVDSKQQKEMEEAKRKLEKAQLEMQKAQIELEKARDEFMRAGGQMRSHDMADLSEEQARHFMMDEQRMREFKLKHEKEFDEQRREMELQHRAMEDNMRRTQEDMRRSAEDMNRERIRHQDMKREMEHFYMMRNDSVMHLRHLQSDMDAYPPAPVPPPAPPADINAPARPDVENPVAPDAARMHLMND